RKVPKALETNPRRAVFSRRRRMSNVKLAGSATETTWYRRGGRVIITAQPARKDKFVARSGSHCEHLEIPTPVDSSSDRRSVDSQPTIGLELSAQPLEYFGTIEKPRKRTSAQPFRLQGG